MLGARSRTARGSPRAVVFSRREIGWLAVVAPCADVRLSMIRLSADNDDHGLNARKSVDAINDQRGVGLDGLQG